VALSHRNLRHNTAKEANEEACGGGEEKEPQADFEPASGPMGEASAERRDIARAAAITGPAAGAV